MQRVLPSHQHRANQNFIMPLVDNVNCHIFEYEITVINIDNWYFILS